MEFSSFSSHSLSSFRKFHRIIYLLHNEGIDVQLTDDLQLSYVAKCYLSRDNSTVLLIDSPNCHTKAIQTHSFSSTAETKEEMLNKKTEHQVIASESVLDCSCVLSIPLSSSTAFALTDRANCFCVKFANSSENEVNGPTNEERNHYLRNKNTKLKDLHVNATRIELESLSQEEKECESYVIWTIEVMKRQVEFDIAMLVELFQHLAETKYLREKSKQDHKQHFQVLTAEMKNYNNVRTLHVDPFAQEMNTNSSIKFTSANCHKLERTSYHVLRMLNDYQEMLNMHDATLQIQQQRVREMSMELTNCIADVRNQLTTQEYEEQTEESMQLQRPSTIAHRKYNGNNHFSSGILRDKQAEEDIFAAGEFTEMVREGVESSVLSNMDEEERNVSSNNYDNGKGNVYNNTLLTQLQNLKLPAEHDNSNHETAAALLAVEVTIPNEHNDSALLHEDESISNNNVVSTTHMREISEEALRFCYVSNNERTIHNNEDHSNDVESTDGMMEEHTMEVATARAIVHTYHPMNLETELQNVRNTQNLMELFLSDIDDHLEPYISSLEEEEDEEKEDNDDNNRDNSSNKKEPQQQLLSEHEQQSRLCNCQRPNSAHVHSSSSLGVIGPDTNDEKTLRMYAEIHGKPFHTYTDEVETDMRDNSVRESNISSSSSISSNSNNITSCNNKSRSDIGNDNKVSPNCSAHSSTTLSYESDEQLDNN